VPDKVETWTLRAMVDLIAHSPDGRLLAGEALLAATKAAYAGAGFEVAVDGAYALHQATLAYEFATRYPQQTLCLELRRDLLVTEFTPFAEMRGAPAKVDKAAAPLAAAAHAVLTASRRSGA
jgi:hypothetical protein